jgi:hypothetical protein
MDNEGVLFKIDVASGRRTEIGRYGRPSGLCFSTDGSMLLVLENGTLHCHDLSVGKEIWTRPSRVYPLAWPTQGDRFIGFREDSRGGSVVLTDTESGEAVASLNLGAEFASDAFFAPSGGELMLVFNRWRAEVLRNTSPDELMADLRRPEQVYRQPVARPTQPLPSPVAPLTSAPSRGVILRLADSLEDISDRSVTHKYLGKIVVAEGKLGNVYLTRQRNAVVAQFADRAQDLIVWIPPDVFPKTQQVWGSDLVKKLGGRQVQVRGKLDRYRTSLEVILSDPSDLQVLESAVPTSRPRN